MHINLLKNLCITTKRKESFIYINSKKTLKENAVDKIRKRGGRRPLETRKFTIVSGNFYFTQNGKVTFCVKNRDDLSFVEKLNRHLSELGWGVVLGKCEVSKEDTAKFLKAPNGFGHFLKAGKVYTLPC